MGWRFFISFFPSNNQTDKLFLAGKSRNTLKSLFAPLPFPTHKFHQHFQFLWRVVHRNERKIVLNMKGYGAPWERIAMGALFEEGQPINFCSPGENQVEPQFKTCKCHCGQDIIFWWKGRLQCSLNQKKGKMLQSNWPSFGAIIFETVSRPFWALEHKGNG